MGADEPGDVYVFIMIALILGFMLATASHAAPLWLVHMYKSYYNGLVYDKLIGLWQYCVKYRETDCVKIDGSAARPDVMEFLHVVRYLNLTGTCLLLVSSLCFILGSKYRNVTAVSSLLSGSAGCLLVGSYAIFAAKVDPKESVDWYFHASFYGDIVASLLAFLASLLLLKYEIFLTSRVTPLRKRTRPIQAPTQYASDKDNNRIERHTLHGARMSRDPGFAMSSKDTVESGKWCQTRMPNVPSKGQPVDSINGTNQVHGSQVETWQESEQLQRGFHQGRSQRVHASRDQSQPRLIRPDEPGPGIPRESRNPWLSEECPLCQLAQS